MTMESTSTGIKVDVGTTKSHLPDAIPPQRDGEHLWLVMAVFRAGDPTKGQFNLDTEALLTIEGPGCYYCEEPWRSGLEHRRCKGEPR